MNRSAQPLYNELYNNLGTPLATSLFYHDAVRSTTGDPSSLLLSDNTTLSPPLPTVLGHTLHLTVSPMRSDNMALH